MVVIEDGGVSRVYDADDAMLLDDASLARMGLMMSFAATNQSAMLWVLFGILGGALAGTVKSRCPPVIA